MSSIKGTCNTVDGQTGGTHENQIRDDRDSGEHRTNYAGPSEALRRSEYTDVRPTRYQRITTPRAAVAMVTVPRLSRTAVKWTTAAEESCTTGTMRKD